MSTCLLMGNHPDQCFHNKLQNNSIIYGPEVPCMNSVKSILPYDNGIPYIFSDPRCFIGLVPF